MGLQGVQLIELPSFVDARGGLTSLEGKSSVPFGIERVFYLHDVPVAATRGNHANYDEHLVIAVAGAFTVLVDDSRAKRRYRLESRTKGLYIPPLIWRTLESFDPGTVCLILSSQKWDPANQITDYAQFQSIVRMSPER